MKIIRFSSNSVYISLLKVRYTNFFKIKIHLNLETCIKIKKYHVIFPLFNERVKLQ